MTFFTLMKMRSVLMGIVLVIAATGLQLRAQDVTVGDIGWFDSEGLPDQPPQAKQPLRVDYPDEMRKAGDVGYAIIFRYLNIQGWSQALRCRASHPSFKHSVEQAFAGWKMRPAMRGGHPVSVQFWVPVIFNPASAAPDLPDATPRLLAVAPVITEEKPPGDEDPVWATVNLDATGAPISFDLESPAARVLRPDIEAALKHWRFAPARKAGGPVAAAIRVAFFWYPPMAPVPLNETPPRVLSQVKPIYPYAQFVNRRRGEVLLAFVVDRTGKVVDPVVVRSSNPAFDQPAIAALLKWKFEPARVNDRAVNTHMTVPIVFEP